MAYLMLGDKLQKTAGPAAVAYAEWVGLGRLMALPSYLTKPARPTCRSPTLASI
jgi:hypothetical protein